MLRREGPRRLRRTTVAAALAVLVVSCGGQTVVDLGEIYSSALVELATVDTTFGAGYRFSEILVLDHLDPYAGNAAGGPAESSVRRLAPEILAAIEAALQEVSPVRVISNPDEWRTESLEPRIQGSAIMGVGEPGFEGDVALVPVSMWCGATCGLWKTYRLERVAGRWTVTGTEGPVAIS